MIKTIVIPQNNTFSLEIPNQYIGKKIEILFYSMDEIVEEKQVPIKPKISDFCGIITDSDYKSLKNHTEKARSEWNRNI